MGLYVNSEAGDARYFCREDAPHRMLRCPWAGLFGSYVWKRLNCAVWSVYTRGP